MINFKSSFKTTGGTRFILLILLKIVDSIQSLISLSLIYPLTALFLDSKNFFNKIEFYFPSIKAFDFNDKILLISFFLFLYIIFRYFFGNFSLKFINSYLISQRFEWINKLSFYFFNQKTLYLNKEKSGKLVSEWYNETYNASIFITLIISIINDITFLLFFLLFVFFTNFKIGVFLILLFTFIFFVYYKLKNNNLNIQSNKKITYLQNLMSTLTEIILHIRDIKIFELESIAHNQVKSSSKNLKKLFISNAEMSKKPLLFSELFIIFIISLNFVLIGLGFLKINTLDISLLVLYFTLGLRSFSYSSQILISFSKLKIEMSSFISLTNKLETINNLNKNKFRINISPLSKIVINNLSFNFDKSKQLFTNVNLEIPLQSHFLINGNSGVGKSTFLDILVGLFPIQKGSITIYDIDNKIICNTYNLYGYVSQNVGLFGETLIECICGNNEYNIDKFQKIIELCNLNFITTNISTFNILSFSGGEKLRIALARALYYERPILILDESLSSIEHTLEIQIIENIKLNFPKITIFQVVHERTNVTSANFRLLFKENNIELVNIN